MKNIFFAFVAMALPLVVFGGLLFARLVSWLLDHYHQSTISALIGLMLGALPTIWPFWATVRVLRPLKLHQTPLLLPVEAIVPSGDWLTWAAGGTAVLSFVIVAAVESAVYRKSAKQA